MKRVEVAKYFTLKGIWKANYICPKFHGKTKHDFNFIE